LARVSAEFSTLENERDRRDDLLTDVSTGGDGIEKSPVDGLDRRLEVLLD